MKVPGEEGGLLPGEEGGRGREGVCRIWGGGVGYTFFFFGAEIPTKNVFREFNFLGVFGNSFGDQFAGCKVNPFLSSLAPVFVRM